ncbi:MAG: threonine synthase [Candidatus Bipolaricaulia bacterium]
MSVALSNKIKAFRCITCGTVYHPGEVQYTCPACGHRRGTLEVVYDYDAIRAGFSKASLAQDREYTLWRYLPILPIEGRKYIQPLQVGWTPLYRFDRLTERYGLGTVYIKDDGRNPTASYKDRASAVAVIDAQERGQKVVTCASTGNAASSLAGFAASTDLKTIIFVSSNAPEAKVAQLLVYGAIVFSVNGNYDQAYDLCMEAAGRYGWYNRNSAINPYLVEGKKTGALEIAEQLNWGIPDRMFVPVGDGSVVSSVYKGFYDLTRLGFIDEIPRIVGVQAGGANPIAKAFERFDGNEVIIEDTTPETVADSISVGKPRDIVKAVTYVSRSGGTFVSVTDEEILNAIKDLARATGVFAEPAAAAAYAGFVQLADAGELGEDERMVVMITGNGLKDIAAARRATGKPYQIAPEINEVEKILDDLDL